MSVKLRRAWMSVGFVVVLLAGLLAGVAVANSNGDTFHACLTNGGDLEKVSTEGPQDCKGNKTPVMWNAVGQPGEDGADGADGADGPPGPPGPIPTVYRVNAASGVVAEGQPVAMDAFCDPGDQVTGGGYSITGQVQVRGSHPQQDPAFSFEGWHVDGFAGFPGFPGVGGGVTVWAMCLDSSS